MQVRFWAATHPGRAREQNEDNFLVDKKLNLFIVADGMGGHAAGEIASSVAVREVRRVIAERRAIIERYVDEESTTGRQELLALIVDAIRQACARIFEMAQEGTERRGMGTTLCMLMMAGRRGFLGHVGDSRIYMLRNSVVEQLTEDHSLVNELIKRGRLKPGDVFDSPYKNAVTRAVGVYETVEVDTLDFDILPGDNFLLCSDGLSCYLENDLTREYLSLESVKDIPDRFIEFANESGGKDNITSVVVRILPDQDELANERLQEVRLKLDTLRAIPMFKYLSYKGLVKVMNITDAQRVPAGTAIFEEGTRGEELYLLLHGRVAIEKGGQRLAELGAGGHFGEMAMVDKSPRSATARALEDCRLLVIQRQQFYEVMRRDPSMAVKLMWSFIQVLNTRLRITNDELLRARDTIESIRVNGAGVVADLPPAEHSLAAFGVLPVGPTDELVPGFLFADSEQPQTDPAVRIDPNSPALAYPDLDLRPGLPVPTSVDVSARSSPPEPAEAEEIETSGFEDDLVPAVSPQTEPEAAALPAEALPAADVPDEALPPTLTAMPALRPRPAEPEDDGIEERSTIDLKRSPRRGRLPDDGTRPPDDEDE